MEWRGEGMVEWRLQVNTVQSWGKITGEKIGVVGSRLNTEGESMGGGSRVRVGWTVDGESWGGVEWRDSARVQRKRASGSV